MHQLQQNVPAGCAGGASTASRPANIFSRTAPVAEPAENPLGSRPGRDQEAPRSHSGAGPHQNCELLADERCSQATLVSSQPRTSEGRQAHRWHGEASEASEWEYREREELAYLREEEERLGAGG